MHSDWSIDPAKRWMARAERRGPGWYVIAPAPVGDLPSFVTALVEDDAPALAGFDMPIGLPVAYGERTGLPGFRAALAAFGTGAWARVFDVCATPEEIGVHRPFYPRHARAGSRRAHLLDGLGLDGFPRLLRACEQGYPGRRAAAPLFWTVGGNQVGKAAICGWRDAIRPALERDGVALWPFDGSLDRLVERNRLVLAETYPAEAGRHLAIRFAGRGGKRDRAARQRATERLALRCARHGVMLDEACQALIRAGFGDARNGEDRFDALVGLLGMIEVADGRRPAMPRHTPDPAWEGWILGQADAGAAAAEDRR